MAAHHAAELARVLFGAAKEVRPWAELQTDLGQPERWSSDRIIPRLVGNMLYFRANHSRMLGAWSGICAVRHPISATWLLLIASAWCYALLVRRGVVHLVTPNGTHLKTVMYPQLHAMLAIGSLASLVLLGRLTFVFSIFVPPAVLAMGHSVMRLPPSRRYTCL